MAFFSHRYPRIRQSGIFFSTNWITWPYFSWTSPQRLRCSKRITRRLWWCWCNCSRCRRSSCASRFTYLIYGFISWSCFIRFSISLFLLSRGPARTCRTHLIEETPSFLTQISFRSFLSMKTHPCTERACRQICHFDHLNEKNVWNYRSLCNLLSHTSRLGRLELFLARISGHLGRSLPTGCRASLISWSKLPSSEPSYQPSGSWKKAPAWFRISGRLGLDDLECQRSLTSDCLLIIILFKIVDQ